MGFPLLSSSTFFAFFSSLVSFVSLVSFAGGCLVAFISSLASDVFAGWCAGAAWAMALWLVAYAVGRRVEAYDMPTIRAIVRSTAARDYRMSDLILGVAKSAAFRTARAEALDATRK